VRKTVRVLLLLFVFTVPWEYSLDLGDPFGNIARILGLMLLLAAIAAVARARHVRTPGALQGLTLAFLLWLSLTYFWSIDPLETLQKLRGYVQEIMIVWIAWEFVESKRDLVYLLRAWLAGSWVLAALTIAEALSVAALAADQVRFAAFGQDPNDVARFLDLGFPVAALLLANEKRWPGRALALVYFPSAVIALLLTASRGGFVAALVALLGSTILLLATHRRTVLTAIFALPLTAACLWITMPRATLERLATIADQLRGGDLNQRLNIWEAGWRAFEQAPLFGHGAGSFVSAARLAPIDTAHNTALSLLVEGGLCAFALAVTILLIAFHSAIQTHGPSRIALITLLLTGLTSSLVGTVAESRTTWLVFAVIACSARLAPGRPRQFADRPQKPSRWAPGTSPQLPLHSTESRS
jgi:O-antigen ligase